MTPTVIILVTVGTLCIAASIPMLNSYRGHVYEAGWAAGALGLLLILCSAVVAGVASTEVTAEEPLSLQLLLDADNIEVVPDGNWGRVLGLDPTYAPYILTCKVES